MTKSFTYPLVRNGGSYSTFYIRRNYATIHNNLCQWRSKDYVTLHKKRIFRYSLELLIFQWRWLVKFVRELTTVNFSTAYMQIHQSFLPVCDSKLSKRRAVSLL